MGKADEKKPMEESTAVADEKKPMEESKAAADEKKPMEESKAAAVAEPKIPFQEFAQTAGLDTILLAGFRAYWTAKGEPTHRTQADWLAAYRRFAAMPA